MTLVPSLGWECTCPRLHPNEFLTCPMCGVERPAGAAVAVARARVEQQQARQKRRATNV